ncbi:MAG TPA: LacI family DNA-binding transcriptional regulator [Aggregatilineaceae bacterium]|nr:LacI family DNA-binding transcriptional regulator [Aggregatilineaceae bacterium]
MIECKRLHRFRKIHSVVAKSGMARRQEPSRELSRRTGRVTAHDVAALVGVSTSTVSRVPSGARTNMISDAARQRVIEAAAVPVQGVEKGYFNGVEKAA